MEKGSIVIQSKKVLALLITITVVLLFAHLSVNIIRLATGHGRLHGISTLFNFFDERNFPTYFSAILLFFSSCLLQIISYIKYINHEKYRYHWFGLAIIFIYLSIDESMELHEKLSAPIQTMLNILPNSMEYWGWVIPFSLFVLVFALYYVPFFFHLNKKFRIYFFLSALLYIFGAIGFELIEAGYGTSLQSQHDFTFIINSLPFFIMVTIEELLEMGGVILFIYSLFEYIKSIPFEISIKFD